MLTCTDISDIKTIINVNKALVGAPCAVTQCSNHLRPGQWSLGIGSRGWKRSITHSGMPQKHTRLAWEWAYGRGTCLSVGPVSTEGSCYVVCALREVRHLTKCECETRCALIQMVVSVYYQNKMAAKRSRGRFRRCVCRYNLKAWITEFVCEFLGCSVGAVSFRAWRGR